jgi:hypothetical protein
MAIWFPSSSNRANKAAGQKEQTIFSRKRRKQQTLPGDSERVW